MDPKDVEPKAARRTNACRRSVGIALYGPAAVHCEAWASSLRVASSGAEMDPVYPSTDKVYILKSLSRSARLLVHSFLSLALWIVFPRCRPTMDVALRSDHGAKIFGIRDDFHFAIFFTVCRHPMQQFMAMFTAVLRPTTFPMVPVEPSNPVHHLERRKKKAAINVRKDEAATAKSSA